MHKMKPLHPDEFAFDLDGLFKAIEAQRGSNGIIHKVLGKTVRTLLNYRSGRTPLSITTYLALVNGFGLDPSKFFISQKQKIRHVNSTRVAEECCRGNSPKGA